MGPGAFEDRFFEDDGESAPVVDESWRIGVRSDEAGISVALSAPLKVILPMGETRPLKLTP